MATLDLRQMFRSALALLLIALLSPLSAFAQQQRAGEVAALITSANRNADTAKLKDTVFWNDKLTTDKTGRVQIALGDGSRLSLGSSSELTVIKHDERSQQTTLDLLYGRLRSKVMKLLQPNSQFQLNTPRASLGVIGTDFYVYCDADRTIVIVYSGVVRVTPRNSGAAESQPQSVDVTAGKMVEITASGAGAISDAPAPLANDGIASTAIKEAGKRTAETYATAGHHLWRNVLVAVATAGAVATTIATTRRGPSRPPSQSIPPQ